MRAVVLLQEMWGNPTKPREQAPRWFRISSANFTGSRLYSWLKPEYDDVRVTESCKELVSSAKERGTPDPKWVSDNLKALAPFKLLLVCGKVAAQTYHQSDAENARIIELPHPAARNWTRRDLSLAGRFIREGTESLYLYFRDGKLRATLLPPF